MSDAIFDFVFSPVGGMVLGGALVCAAIFTDSTSKRERWVWGAIGLSCLITACIRTAQP
jgi:hypothetical protein